MTLSDAAVRALEPRERDYKVTDEKGLYLIVRATGGKLWRYDYTLAGKRRSLSIGVYPDISLAIARQRRLEARRLLSAGVDPSAAKQARKRREELERANTFKAVAEKLIAEGKKKNLARRTITKKEWLLSLVYPHIGNRVIGELTPADVLKALKSIELSGRLESARRARQVMSEVFRRAAIDGLAAGDPTPLLRGQIQVPRVTSYPAIIREDEFGELLRRIQTCKRPIISLALQFLSLTFVRSGELRLAKWPEIDLEDNVWRVPAERMKMKRPHDVPLCAATRAILKQARALYPFSWETNGYIFPSPIAPRQVMSENTFNQSLKLLGYRGTHSAHGFRSSASTILNERGVARSEVIEAQLAHIEENDVKRAYNRAQYWAEREKLMSDWAKICAELRDGTKATRKHTVRALQRDYSDLI